MKHVRPEALKIPIENYDFMHKAQRSLARVTKELWEWSLALEGVVRKLREEKAACPACAEKSVLRALNKPVGSAEDVIRRGMSEIETAIKWRKIGIKALRRIPMEIRGTRRVQGKCESCGASPHPREDDEWSEVYTPKCSRCKGIARLDKR